ncbi:MAG: 2-amino-4-hydroxy-6-hydroxymethyldihydropteridine diphosphokinase [Bacteroidales bacterium]
MCKVYLGLGSNQGDRLSYLQQATQAIENEIGELRKSSSYYETEPWGFEDENKFINQVIEISTDLSPVKILNHILLIEKHLGRVREKNENGYSGRIIDIDILFYENHVVDIQGLTIPHPYICNRMFVLKPLCEIAPQLVHPIQNKSIEILTQECRDKHTVKKLSVKEIFSRPHLVSDLPNVTLVGQRMM